MPRELSRAERCLEYVFKGLHHVSEHRIKRESATQITYTHYGDLSTWDSDELTRLVVVAHSLAVRVEVSACSTRYICLRLSERTREGDTCKGHPTLADHLAALKPPTQEDSNA